MLTTALEEALTAESMFSLTLRTALGAALAADLTVCLSSMLMTAPGTVLTAERIFSSMLATALTARKDKEIL